MDSLIVALRRIRRRLLLVRAAEAGLAGAIGAAQLVAVITVIRIFLPQHVPLTATHPALPLVLVPCGFAIAALVRLVMGVSLRDAALAADRSGALKERLATALEVVERRGDTRDGRADGPGVVGVLDDRLLAQARAAAERLDVRQLHLAFTMGRHAKVLLVGVVVLVAATFIPPVGGPALAPEAAGRAAASLERAAASGSVAPALKTEIERAVARLREPGTRAAGADRATAAIYQAAAKAEAARQDVLAAVSAADNADVQAMARAAAKGDGAGAASAAGKAADSLGSPPGAGGMPLADRERLADGLWGAAATARQEHLTDLAARLEAAAEAVRRADPAPAVGEAMSRLAAAMTEALGPASSGGVAAVVEAVVQARRALGLAESPPEPAQGPLAPRVSPGGQSATTAPVPAEATTTGTAIPGAESPIISADVRPEDRDVVRRYFGG